MSSGKNKELQCELLEGPWCEIQNTCFISKYDVTNVTMIILASHQWITILKIPYRVVCEKVLHTLPRAYMQVTGVHVSPYFKCLTVSLAKTLYSLINYKCKSTFILTTARENLSSANKQSIHSQKIRSLK